jgi:hypothetical protein
VVNVRKGPEVTQALAKLMELAAAPPHDRFEPTLPNAAVCMNGGY